jgi:hypothetical protein
MIRPSLLDKVVDALISAGATEEIIATAVGAASMAPKLRAFVDTVRDVVQKAK